MPVNTGDALYPMRVMMFITLLCMGYQLSRPIPTGKRERELLMPQTTGSSATGDTDLPDWQLNASGKAIERYAASQGKKWHRWNEAMFERSG